MVESEGTEKGFGGPGLGGQQVGEAPCQGSAKDGLVIGQGGTQAGKASGQGDPGEGHERIDPLFNEAFVRIFGREKSKNVTKSLVNAVLGAAGIPQIDAIDRIDSEYTQVDGTVECKSARYDVRIVTENQLVDLEAQCYPEKVENRSLYYAAKLISSSLYRGDSYADLPQVTIITLLDTRSLFPAESEFIAVGRLCWQEGEAEFPGTDRLALVVVELEKFRKRYNDLDEEVMTDELLSWLYLLTSGYRDNEELMAMAKGFPTIEEFAQLYGVALNDPDLARAYESYDYEIREQKRRDEYYARLEREGMERGLKQGLEQGLEQGRAEERALLVAGMRAQGVPEDVISAIIGSVA